MLFDLLEIGCLIVYVWCYLCDNWIMKKMNLKIGKNAVIKAAAISSKMEGISFARAKKNLAVIKLLKKHGRAFSI